MNIFKSRKFRQGSLATAITVMVIVLIVIVNMVATVLSSRFSISIDMTENRAFSLSGETVDLLKNVNKDVTVYILASEDDFVYGGDPYYIQANEVIGRYAQHTQYIDVVYMDIVKNPDFRAKYPNLALVPGNVIVECGNNSTMLTAYDLFNVQTNYETARPEIVSSKAEQAMSSAILNVTSDERIVVSVIGGHGELSTSAFTNLLAMNNYEIIEQNLTTALEIDPEATIAIMCAPVRDISEEDAKKLDAFMENSGQYGKMLLYFASTAQATQMPVMDAFLAEWGIKVNPGTIFELNRSNLFALDMHASIPTYSETTLSESVRMRGLPMAIPNARPMEKVFEESGFTSTLTLLEFSPTAGVKPANADSAWTPGQNDVSGPIPAVILAEQRAYDGKSAVPMRSQLLAVSSMEAISEYALGYINLANADYLLNVLGRFVGRENVMIIQDKTMGGQQLGISGAQIVSIAVVFAIVLPVAVFIFGIVTWMRRRHR